MNQKFESKFADMKVQEVIGVRHIFYNGELVFCLERSFLSADGERIIGLFHGQKLIQIVSKE